MDFYNVMEQIVKSKYLPPVSMYTKIYQINLLETFIFVHVHFIIILILIH